MGGRNSYESIKKYQDKAYDSVNLRLKKGEREVVKEFADKKGKSLNAFIVEAIKEKMENDK